MLTVYVKDSKQAQIHAGASDVLPPGALWIDLLNPEPDEEALVEKILGLDVPTLEEMREIETSNMLYRREQAVFMTAVLLSETDTKRPKASPVTFILSGGVLISVRYSEPRSFHLFAEKFKSGIVGDHGAEGVLADLIQTIINRLSDVLEKVYTDVDGISHTIFHHREEGQIRDFERILRSIGEKGDLNSKLRESLVSLGRVVNYFELSLCQAGAKDQPLENDIATLGQDIAALLDHASFLSGKINFLLDASLGMINIQQNTIIKFFSVAAVVFLPPTLVASVYGMNFKHMPELQWDWGYPAALAVMVFSAVIPYKYFRKRGWL